MKKFSLKGSSSDSTEGNVCVWSSHQCFLVFYNKASLKIKRVKRKGQRSYYAEVFQIKRKKGKWYQNEYMKLNSELL